MVSPVKFSNHLIAGEVRVEVKPHQAVALRSPKLELRSVAQSIGTEHEISALRFLVHNVVTEVESGYAKLTRNPHYQEPKAIASWEELSQRLPSREQLWEGGLMLAGTILSRGRKPNVLTDVLSRPKSRAPKKTAGALSETQVQEKKMELGTLRNQLRVMQNAGSGSFTEQIKGWAARIQTLEKELASHEAALSKTVKPSSPRKK